MWLRDSSMQTLNINAVLPFDGSSVLANTIQFGHHQVVEQLLKCEGLMSTPLTSWGALLYSMPAKRARSNACPFWSTCETNVNQKEH